MDSQASAGIRARSGRASGLDKGGSTRLRSRVIYKDGREDAVVEITLFPPG